MPSPQFPQSSGITAINFFEYPLRNGMAYLMSLLYFKWALEGEAPFSPLGWRCLLGRAWVLPSLVWRRHKVAYVYMWRSIAVRVPLGSLAGVLLLTCLLPCGLDTHSTAQAAYLWGHSKEDADGREGEEDNSGSISRLQWGQPAGSTVLGTPCSHSDDIKPWENWLRSTRRTKTTLQHPPGIISLSGMCEML